MTSDPETPPRPDPPGAVELPAATVWPMVLGLGIVLLAAGLATSLALSVVGAAIFIAGLVGWIGQLLPGQGHVHEPLAQPLQRARPVTGTPGTVEHMRAGMPGFRMRLPDKVHPISAGIKGGIVGGLVMPIPAFAYGLLSGHGIWFPINLLAGMVLASVDETTPVAQLEQFDLGLLVVGTIIHAVISVTIGLMYGVLLPTFPRFPGGPIVFGGLIMPLLWTGASYGMMGVINPVLQKHVDWPWFIASQFVYGVAAALVVIRSEQIHIPPAGQGPDRAADFVTGQDEGQS